MSTPGISANDLLVKGFGKVKSIEEVIVDISGLQHLDYSVDDYRVT